MTGVGVGASPAFFNSSRDGDKGGDEDGGDTGGEERQRSGVALERTLLRRTVRRGRERQYCGRRPYDIVLEEMPPPPQ